MSSRLGADISSRGRDAQVRELEVMQYDDELSLAGIDPYVGYEMTWALENYIAGVYGACVVFCGLAIEEQLGLKFEAASGNDASNETFATLTSWARNNGLVDSSWGDDDKALDELRDVRNYFAHANRVIASKTRKKVARGEFNLLLPHRPAPHLGDLDSRDCALNAIRYTSSILRRLR